MTTLSFVDVRAGDEFASVAVDDDKITYSGVADDVARAVVEHYAEDHSLTPADAARRLAANGWSNGYIMIALPGTEAADASSTA